MAATTPKTSIEEKLMLARIEFGKAEKKKSGVNKHAEFTYYELSDIVPVATSILYNLSLLYIVNFEGDTVVGRLIDFSTKDEIDFKIPYREIQDPAKYRMHEVQSCGAGTTYYRRYSYMQMLDIVEPDAFDGTVGEDMIEEKTPKVKPPKTTQEREEIKDKLIPQDVADETHVKKLKKVCKQLKEIGREDFVNNIVLKTDKFTTGTNAEYEALIEASNNILKGGKTE